MAANPGYEIRAQLYSLLKSTRTLIAKAIGREKCEILSNLATLSPQQEIADSQDLM